MKNEYINRGFYENFEQNKHFIIVKEVSHQLMRSLFFIVKIKWLLILIPFPSEIPLVLMVGENRDKQK